MKRVVGESDAQLAKQLYAGKKAPVLVTAEMVQGMVPVGQIRFEAAERGGNCELTRAEQTIGACTACRSWARLMLAGTVPYHAEPDVFAEPDDVSHAAGKGREAERES